MLFCDETLNMAKDLKAGEILLLENMRFEAGETKMMKSYVQN